MNFILVFILILLPLLVHAEPYKITETDQGIVVEYNGNTEVAPKMNYTKDELEKKQLLEANVGKKYWTTKENTSFYELPDCRSKYKLPKGQWFTIKRLIIEEMNQDIYFQLSNPRYEVYLENGSSTCFSQLFSGNIDNNINIFKEDKNQRTLNLLAENGIEKGKTLWTKYPFQGYPAFTKLKINDVKVEADTLAFENISIIAVINNNKQGTITTNSIITLSGQFYQSDPKKITAKWDKKTLEAISTSKILIGMTKDQATASWGQPENINRTVGSWGVKEQWVYGLHTYLYFTNGILTSWQD